MEAAVPLPWVCPWPWHIYLGHFTKVEAHKRPWSALKCQSCMNHFNCSYQPHDYSVNIPLGAYCSELLLLRAYPCRESDTSTDMYCPVIENTHQSEPSRCPHTSRMNRSRLQMVLFYNMRWVTRSRNQVILSVIYHCHNYPAVKLNQPVTVIKTKVV